MKKTALVLAMLLVGCTGVEPPKKQDIVMQQYCKLTTPDNYNSCLVEEAEIIRIAHKMLSAAITEGKVIFPDTYNIWELWLKTIPKEIAKCENAREYTSHSATVFFNCMRKIKRAISEEELLENKDYETKLRTTNPEYFK